MFEYDDSIFSTISQFKHYENLKTGCRTWNEFSSFNYFPSNRYHSLVITLAWDTGEKRIFYIPKMDFKKYIFFSVKIA